MGKTNNRAAEKWYANREVMPGARDKQVNILSVAETGIWNSSETAAGGVCGGEDFRKPTITGN